jgi:cytochrome d ubiquinol oxidase subunit II
MQLTWTYLAPLIFMAVMGLALLTYVVLDGYDLGVGMLLPFATPDEKDVMVSSIGPFWDANETWLVLGVGVLLVAFPAAHGVVLQALYLPVAVMLIGLVLRGVAFDFRVKAHADHKPLWNRLFASGSLVASLAQGWMLGSYITGFDNGVWACCSAPALH